MTMRHCDHCGLPVLDPGRFRSAEGDQIFEFCCPGCCAVAKVIRGAGLDQYYAQREPGNLPASWVGEADTSATKGGLDENDWTRFDHPTAQVGWVEHKGDEGNERSVFLLVEGVHCAACVWLIEHFVGDLKGVECAAMNYANHQLEVTLTDPDSKISEVFYAISKIGYRAHPYSVQMRQKTRKRLQKTRLRQIGVAGALGMQIMVLSVALYAGDWFGIEADVADFLRRTSLLLTLPILFYSARPFFEGAINAIKIRRAGMDLPVSIGILLAFLGSVWTIIEHSGNAGARGETYFDSIAMFVFFLLSARYIELSTRIRSAQVVDRLVDSVPATCRLIRAEEAFSVPNSDVANAATDIVGVDELEVGDRILIRPGDAVPADGVIIRGSSSVSESLLTGESYPVARTLGEEVIAGSMNIDGTLWVKVVRTSDESTLSSIQKLTERTSQKKPRLTALSEKLSGWFVATVLLIASICAGLGWYLSDPNWLGRTIAILVVTCPCALSLATPLALTASASSLLRRGICVVNQHVLETMAKVDHFVFDKTGTLTQGELSLINIVVTTQDNQQKLSPAEELGQRWLQLAASLEAESRHPIAKAFSEEYGNQARVNVESRVHEVGGGVAGRIDGQWWCLGSVKFVHQQLRSLGRNGISQGELNAYLPQDQVAVILVGPEDQKVVFSFDDTPRAGAAKLIAELKGQGKKVTMLTGDRSGLALKVAGQLGIARIDVFAELSPEDKAGMLSQFVKRGDAIAMVGDGLNDSAALVQSHVSIAVSRDLNLTSAQADVILLTDRIDPIGLIAGQSKRSLNIIRQNMSWALAYNLLALPLAIMGMVPPWLAAIGMSLSSALVVINSWRLMSIKLPQNPQTQVLNHQTSTGVEGSLPHCAQEPG